MKTDSGKCLHYYFYFIDPAFGLCYLRVPTWSPFRLQFYMNGHNWLASRLAKQGITYRMWDNAFLEISDWAIQWADAAFAMTVRLSIHEKKTNQAETLLKWRPR